MAQAAYKLTADSKHILIVAADLLNHNFIQKSQYFDIERVCYLMIRLSIAKSLLWFIAILYMVFSFPLQVYANSPYPSLFPYVLIGIVILMGAFFPRESIYTRFSVRQNSNINLMVGIYIFLVLFHTTWQIIFEVIDLIEAANIVVVYLLPTIFYWYFRSLACEQEIKFVLVAIVTGGFIVGIFFVYDSYMKLALGQLSDFSIAAFQYSLDRGGKDIEESNNARVNLGSRSMGLLQSHTISGAWVVICAFAALALIPSNRKIIRRISILVFGVMLLLGLNFSSIIAFIIIIFLIEFEGYSLLHGQLLGKTLRNLGSFFLVITIIAGTSIWVAGDRMLAFIQAVFDIQIDLLFGLEAGNLSMFGLLSSQIESYVDHILDSPLALLFGDGFSSYGLPRGGDIGAIETLAQFGLPFYILILLGFFGLVRSGLWKIKVLCGSPVKGETCLDQQRVIQFAISVTLLIIVLDSHYSAWAAKSILPIVFFVLALHGRYQESPSQMQGGYLSGK